MTLIQRLKELEARATPRPWYADTGDSYSPVRSDSGPICDCDVEEFDTEQGKLNSMLIADMRNALPKILNVVKAAIKFAEHYDGGGSSFVELQNTLAALESLTM